MSNIILRFKFQKMRIESKRITKGLESINKRNTVMLTSGIKFFKQAKFVPTLKSIYTL